jgi:hypothetical protein
MIRLAMAPGVGRTAEKQHRKAASFDWTSPRKEACMVGQPRNEFSMPSQALTNALSPLLTMIRSRLQEAHSIAAAAESCAATGNYDGATRILLDIDELLFDATNLVNAVCAIRREAG